MAGPGNQTTLISTVSLPEFTDLVRRQWLEVQEFLPKNALQMFVMDPIGMGNGNTRSYNEYDFETYADNKVEGGPLSKGKTGVGYNKTMYLKTVGKQVDITLEDRTYNRYAEVQSKITSLFHFCPERRELDLTHVFTFSTSTSYVDKNGDTVDTTTGDGLSLANTAHTLAFSSTTYSNRVAGDPAFSQTSLEAALLLAATNIYNNFGERRRMKFNAIFCFEDPGTEREIDQLINSTADIDAVQAGVVNVYRSKFIRVSLPQLATDASGAYDSTKRRWWGIAAIGQGLQGWQGMYAEARAPELHVPAPGNNGEDVDTLNWTYGTVAMYGISTPTPRGIIFSCPTS